MKTWLALSKTAFKLLLILSLLTGMAYPLLVTVCAQFFFPTQANGSLITVAEHVVGSQHIGQLFTDEKYFWGRPSAAAYDATTSSASNSGPSNPLYLATVQERMQHLRDSDPQHRHAVPIDLVSASGSGLDPEISPQAAMYQIPRIAKARRLTEQALQKLVLQHTQSRTLGCLGEPRVHVLRLNLALDQQRATQEGD